MAILKKKVDVKTETVVETPVVETPVVVPETLKCECGEPVATELGQTFVCKKHIRTS